MKTSKALALATALILSASLSPAESDVRKIGEPFMPVSALTSTVESLDPEGRFVLVWQESVQPDPPAAVKARRHAWSGPLADPLTISGNALLLHRDSAPNGRFLVSWLEPDPWTRHARLFERDATAVEASFTFPNPSGSGESMSVADDGSFVMVWMGSDQDRITWRQRFDASGVALESPVVVDDLGPSEGQPPGRTGVEHTESGEFVIVWSDPYCAEYGGCYACLTHFFSQRFDADGWVSGPLYHSPIFDNTPLGYPTLSVAANGPSVAAFAPYGYCSNAPYVHVARDTPEHETSLAFQIYSGGAARRGASAINRHAEFVVEWETILYSSYSVGDIHLRLFDPVGRAVGPDVLLAEDVARFPQRPLHANLNDHGQILASWYDIEQQVAHQRLCFDPAVALITTGSGFKRLQVLDVPDGTTRHGFRLRESQSTLPGVETVTTPHGRQALVATTAEESVLTLFDIGNGFRRHDVDLGQGRSLVAGGSPVLVDDEGELAIVATQQGATGEPALHYVDLTSGAVLHFLPATLAETLVADLRPIVVSDGTAAVLATNALDGISASLHRVQLLGGDAMHHLSLGPGETLLPGVGPVASSDGVSVVVGTNPTFGGAPVVRVLDPADISVDGVFALDPGGLFQRGVPPVLSENGSRAVVATHGSVARVRIFDLTGPSIDSVIDLALGDTLLDDAGFVRGPDGNTAMLATRSPEGVWFRAFDLAAGSLIHELLLPGQTLVSGVGPTVSPSGKHAYLLTAGTAARIDRIDLTTGTAGPPLLLDSGETIVPGVDLRLTSDESVLVAATKNVTNSGTVLRLLDPGTLSLLHRLDLGPGEQPVEGTRVVETRCGFTVLLSTRGSQGRVDTVRMIDVETGQVNRALELSSSGSLVPGVGPALPASSVVGDCNANLQLDTDDIAAGASDDCDLDGTPDECQADCNDNGVADSCDVASGGSADLDGNGVPDECEPDCNENDVLDRWEIVFGAAEDCNGDGVPDECDADCNVNTVPDGCDIFEGTSPDCNGDGIPDECQPGLDSDLDGHPECSDNCPLLANATQSDHDLDGVGDACDPDDDNDGVPDLLDNCRFDSNRDQLNTDADTEGDACDDDDDGDSVLDVLDNCIVVWNPDQQNGDGDPRGDHCDCAAGDDTAWTAPSEARNLRFQSWGVITWEAPGEPGGDVVLYDLIRSDVARDFGGAVCIVSGTPNLLGTDVPAPPPGEVFHFLVRARNGCPGSGTLGTYSDGTPRTGNPCP